MHITMNQDFKNKTIIIGVTGGIAAYKTADLVSKLKQAGADVWVVMTPEAAKLVTPLTFRTLSGNPVITDLFSEELSSIRVPHIAITEKADLMIIAPATANMIGKIAQGIADDPLSTMVMASKAPKLIAPAMNKNMWANPIVKENISKLEGLGYQMIGPEVGWLACGDEGAGRMAEVPAIIAKASEIIESSCDLKGVRILVTAGGTREAIDPVRFIGNRSSGKMGYAVARAAVDRGAQVTLITTPLQIEKPSGCRVVEVETAQQMKQAVLIEAKRADAVVMAAAVADYRPTKSQKTKLKKQNSKLKIELQKTDDILETLGKNKGKKVLVGFSLETSNLIENSKKKLTAKNLDLVVANTEEAFDKDESRVHLIYNSGRVENLGKVNKSDTANRILDFVRNNRASRKDQIIIPRVSAEIAASRFN
jgi:phosphopantothenoylcysteine decarboxylase/phosphopantothenate--cysteine ligase